jgi:glycosyltransferase involved in cell wall biosynthesis
MKVSFCCPAYNKEEYMSQMIMMFLDQTYKNCELIIVDDASTDGTQELCEYYANKHKNIKYFRNLKNIGVADSRNLARQFSTGDIICVQDADDQSVNGRAEMTVEFFKKNKHIDLLYGSTVLIDDLGVERGTLKAEQFVVSRLKTKNFISHPTLAYRKSMPVLYRHGLRYIDDWYFLLDCYLQGYKFGYLTNILAAWRVTKGGLSYDMGSEQGEKKEAKEAFKKEFEAIDDDISDILRKSPEQRARFREILKRIPKGSTILDIGCNGGYSLELFSKKGDVCGVEIAPNLIEICENKGFKMLRKGEAFPNVDVVVLGDILEHYTEVKAKNILNMAYHSAQDRVIITIPYPDGRFGTKFVPEHKADYVLQNIQDWLPRAKMKAIPIYYSDDAIPLWSLIEVFK